MTTNRKIILNGDRNVCHLGAETDISIYAGQTLENGRVIVDQQRMRAYSVSAQNPSSIVLREIELSPREYHHQERLLDHPLVAGELHENNAQILFRKKVAKKTG